MLYTPGAVVLGLVYSATCRSSSSRSTASVEKLDNSLVEAAFDLGAGPIRTFQKVILPLTQPGIVAGILLVFIPAIGMFAITQLMGGGIEPTIGEVIQNQFLSGARLALRRRARHDAALPLRDRVRHFHSQAAPRRHRGVKRPKRCEARSASTIGSVWRMACPAATGEFCGWVKHPFVTSHASE